MDILDHLKNDCDREFIKEHLRLSDEQLDSAIEYIALHREEIEREYADILARSEERRNITKSCTRSVPRTIRTCRLKGVWR